MSQEQIDKFVKNHMEKTTPVFVKPSEPKKKNIRTIWKNTIIVSVIVILAAAAGYFFWQYRSATGNTNTTTEKENQALITKIGKLIDLPQAEKPTVATVSDKSQLTDQDFFSTAENGDKILVYGSYRMVILYRPSLNKIMKVAPLVYGDTTNTNTNQNTNTNTNTGTTNTNS